MKKQVYTTPEVSCVEMEAAVNMMQASRKVAIDSDINNAISADAALANRNVWDGVW